MLNSNTVGQVKTALEEGAKDGKNPELVERLNICKIVLGKYELFEKDLDVFKGYSSDEFEGFYKKWLYRPPDGVEKNGSGIILALCRMIEKLDEYRISKNITQEYADKVRKEIEDKREQLKAQEAVASEIKRENSELAELQKQLDELNAKTRELEELKAKKTGLNELIKSKKDILSNEDIGRISTEIKDLKVEFNKELTLDIAIKMAKLFADAEIFNKLNLDLLCEYVEDEKICEEIKKSERGPKEYLDQMKSYEVQIDKTFRDYKELLKKIIEKNRGPTP